MKKSIEFFLIIAGILSTFSLQSCTCSHEFKFSRAITNPTELIEGQGLYLCEKCEAEKTDILPILNDINYNVSKKESTCYSYGEIKYESSLYGTYSVQIDKLSHTSYGGFCLECEEVINNLYFDPDDFIRISSTGGYPRLYILEDGTWLCGYDIGTIYVCRSEDEGQTWSKPVSASVHSNYVCANVAFHQLSNGDILCAYRAIGKDSISYKREIQCTISKDGGLTWNYHSTIEDNVNLAEELGYNLQDVKDSINLEGRIGFFEPHFGIINDQLTVMYADDFSTMITNPRNNVALNYETQFIISRTYNENSKTWDNRKIILDGTIRKTVGGITEYSRDGMPVFDQLSDGTYVLVVEGTYRRTSSNGNNPFIILLSYSKDGINWSTPTEVYVPKGNGTKASAPYICITSDDRIIISFQTDEDSAAHNKGKGDNVSMMKTIISDGTPVEEITKENFSESINVFGLEPGNLSSWNGMYMHEDILYCVSGVKGKNVEYGVSLNGIYLASSLIPTLDNVSTYSDKICDSIPYNITMLKGELCGLESGWIRTISKNNIFIFNDYTLNSGSFTLDMIPYYYAIPQVEMFNNEAGIIFNASQDGKNYYSLLINDRGTVILKKITNGNSINLSSSIELQKIYSRLNRYQINVEFENGEIYCYVNDDLLIEYIDENPLDGEYIGAYSLQDKVLFKNPVVN